MRIVVIKRLCNSLPQELPGVHLIEKTVISTNRGCDLCGGGEEKSSTSCFYRHSCEAWRRRFLFRSTTRSALLCRNDIFLFLRYVHSQPLFIILLRGSIKFSFLLPFINKLHTIFHCKPAHILSYVNNSIF